MSNSIAQLVLFSWPLVVYILFQRLPLREALVWSIVAGYLILPTRTGFDLPVLPPVDKTLVPSLAAAIMCFGLVFKRRILEAQQAKMGGAILDQKLKSLDVGAFEPKRGTRLFWALMIFLFSTPILTAMQNGETLIVGTRSIQGMSLYDAMSMNSTLLVQIIPFLLARRFLSSEEDHKALLKILVIACLAYSLLALYEVRMSPQLNRKVYGFFPHSWSQHLRGDGFRPIVFLQHGLWLSIFICYAVIAAFSLSKAGDAKDRNPAVWVLAGIWLFGVLFLTKSLGAFALAVLIVPVVVIFGRKIRLLIAAFFAIVVILYPIARGADVVPVDTVFNIAESINPSRARSFYARVYNEDILLEKANEKPLTGWGIWSRARVFNEAGKDISVADGYWVIVMGEYGKLGYLAQFGFLCLPLIFLSLRQRRIETSQATVGVALVLCVGLIDLIPNATSTPVLWLVAGAILGHYQTAATKTGDRKFRAQTPATVEPAPNPIAPSVSSQTSPPMHQRRPRQARYD